MWKVNNHVRMLVMYVIKKYISYKHSANSLWSLWGKHYEKLNIYWMRILHQQQIYIRDHGRRTHRASTITQSTIEQHTNSLLLPQMTKTPHWRSCSGTAEINSKNSISWRKFTSSSLLCREQQEKSKKRIEKHPQAVGGMNHQMFPKKVLRWKK